MIKGINAAIKDGNHWVEVLFRSWQQTFSYTKDNSAEVKEVTQSILKNMEDFGNYWGLTWPGQLLAAISMREGNLAEAKEHFHTVLHGTHEIEFRRGTQYISNHIGDVEFLLHEFKEAEHHFLESLQISQDIGQTREMLGTLFDLAKLRAATQREKQAVEILAVVIPHPASNQRSLFKEGITQEISESLRGELEEKLNPDEYTAAWERGKKQDLENIIIKLLLEHA